MMQTFLIISSSKEGLEKEVEKLLAPLHIDAFDIRRIKPENSIGIEEIRELKLAISLKPFRSQTKAVVIEEAQKLTIQAQNALLKTLEEPPDHTIIILLVEGNIDTLLPTVVSRCQVIQLPITNNQQLTTSELEVMSKQLAVTLGKELGEKLKLAEEIGKDKNNAAAWLEKMIISTRQRLIDEITINQNNPFISQLLDYLITFQKTHTLLSTTNVNPRLALENLFVSIN